MFNLLTDACFPVLRRDGRQEAIRFADLTSQYGTNPVVDFVLPRPDFQGSAYQLGIAWLQTAFPPQDDEDWEDWLVTPPTPDQLTTQFQPYAEAFRLWAPEGPAFMQDLEALGGDSLPLQALFIDGPNESSLKHNTDHFLKRGILDRLGSFATAMTLFCMQTHAPSGGRGHRTSLRGGGPLTSIPLGGTLWESLWLNVFDHATFVRNEADAERWPAKPPPEAIFPWLAPTKTSEGKNDCVFQGQVHPLQVYWAMPRRFRLDPPVHKSGQCPLMGTPTSQTFHSFTTKSYGNNYEGVWRHPLTPHYLDKDGAANPRHGQPGGLAYRHWLGLVLDVANSVNIPAQTVSKFLGDRRSAMADLFKSRHTQTRLWVFGYDMDNMKPRGWVESIMPLLVPQGDQQNDFETAVEGFINAATRVASTTKKAYASATCGRAGKTRGDLGFVDVRFWEATSEDFYAHLHTLCKDPCGQTTAEAWLKHLHQAAIALFDELTAIRPVDCDPIDPSLWAKAKNDLVKFTSYRGEKLRIMVGLPPLEKKKQGEKA